MKTLTKEEISQIRNSVDIVDVVSSYINLTPKGKNYFGVCPFHDDNNPSLSVSKEKQIYTCFSCGATGSVINFMMDYEQITFLETMKKLANMAGISIDVGDYKFTPKFEEIYEMYDISKKIYINNLYSKEGKTALEYLEKRGISKENIETFSLGLSLSKSLEPILESNKYEEKNILDSGLFYVEGNNKNDIFRNRIMFPIEDTKGHVVAFSGREYITKSDNKYINSRETKIFKKSEILYNYRLAKEHSRISKRIIIVEGFLDVFSMYDIGYKDVVATMGTAITKEHATLISRIAKDVILMFDGDKAGEKATISALKEFEKINIHPKVIRLKDNLDPDEYIKKYKKAGIDEALNTAMNAIDFKMQHLKTEKNILKTEDASSYIRSVLDEVKLIDDEILKEMTLKKLSEEVNLDINFLRDQLNSAKKAINVPKKENQVHHTNKYEMAERYLLYYMLKDPRVINIYKRKVKYMPTYECRLLAIEILEYYNNYKTINVADLFTEMIGKDNFTKLLGEILSLDLKEEITDEEINDYVNVLNECFYVIERKKLMSKMMSASTQEEKLMIAEKLRKLKVSE